MLTMCGVSVLLLPLLSLTVASPVTDSGLEVPVPEINDPNEKGLLLPLLGLYGLYSLYEHLMGSTPPTSEVTTPAPGVTTPGTGVTTPTSDTTTKSGLFGWWPNNGGFLGFGLFGKTTETATTTTETVTTTTATTTTTTTTTPTPTTTTPTTAPPTTTKCGGLIGGGLLFC